MKHGSILTRTIHLDILQASQYITRPLVSTQEDGTATTDPSYARAYTGKEGAWARLVQYLLQHGQHGLLLLGQHHARLQHIQGRGYAGGDGTGHAAQQTALYAADLGLATAVGAPALQGLPERELYDGEGDFAKKGDAPAAIQLHPHTAQATGVSLVEDVGEGGERARMLARLGSLLDDFGRNPHGAGSDLAQAGCQHVHTGLPSPGGIGGVLDEGLALGIVGYGRGRGREVSLDGVVGDEEEGCARGGADDGAADAAVDAGEAARGREAARGLEAGFEGVERVEGEVDGGACEAAGLVGVSQPARELGTATRHRLTMSDRRYGDSTHTCPRCGSTTRCISTMSTISRQAV